MLYRVILPNVYPEHPAVKGIHTWLASSAVRASHGISQGMYGYFHEIRGQRKLEPATFIDIFSHLDEEELKQTISDQDWSETENAEIASIASPHGEEIVALKVWTTSKGKKQDG